MLELTDIKKIIKNQNTLNLIIGSNVLLFLLSQILIAFNWFSLRYVALSISFNDLGKQWWGLITYGFFHQGFLALFFNMLLLFYFGSIMCDFTSGKKILKVYFLGILLGAVFFLFSYQWLPDFYIIKSPLLGASAGIIAIITYISLLTPHYQIKIRFLGYFKLIHILIFLILFNLLQIPLGNPGGYFAHLGGLTAGFIWYWIDQFFKTKKLKNSPGISFEKNTQKSKNIDAILDKISRSGYESLSQKEKEELFKQSKK